MSYFREKRTGLFRSRWVAKIRSARVQKKF